MSEYDTSGWYTHLTSGLSDEEIAEKEGVEVEDVIAFRERAIAAEVARIRRPVEEVYADYRTRMEGVIRNLDIVVSHAINVESTGSSAKRQLRTASDAIKAQAKIIDMVVHRGQELGVLPRAALTKNTNVRHSGGVIIGAMSTEELLKHNKELADKGRQMRKEYEQIPFTSMPAPDIYAGQTVIDAEPVAVQTPRSVVRRKS